MRNISFEDAVFLNQQPIPVAPLLEAYRGVQVVGWYGQIERHIDSMLNKFESDKNFIEADKVRQFLKTWRGHQITGSVNREDLEVLQAAAAQLAVDPWKASSFFSSLRTSIDQLIASEEELPRMPAEPPTGGGMPKMTGAPVTPMSQFGPQDEAPPGEPGQPDGQPGGQATPPPGGVANNPPTLGATQLAKMTR
jgi:hypothetical protein